MNMNHNLPNFIVFGASKSGTTSIYQYLKEHPDVFLPEIKEINFFAYDEEESNRMALDTFLIRDFPAKTLDDYKSLFAVINNEIAIGEASPIYLTSPIAAEKIKGLLPDVKLIASLRNPVDRAISSYYMHFRAGREKRSIEDVFSDVNNEYYVLAGNYYKLLARYYDLFSHDQIKIVLFEDLKHDATKVMQEIYKFIGVEDEFRPYVNKTHNRGGVPSSTTNKYVFSAINGISKLPLINSIKDMMPRELKSSTRQSIENRLLHYPEVNPEIRMRLAKYYNNDIEKLAVLINKDLSAWSNLRT